MPSPRTGVLALLAPPPALSDADLIGRYVRRRDEAAFAAVVRRHGRMVLGVCRRMLGCAADADDAFQATFLTLAKKAHRVAFREDAAAWLFAVAVRACRELRRRRAVRANRETLGPVPDVAATTDSFDVEAGRIVLDEVANLSAAYRAAVALCELDGVSRADAARRLGIPEGTLSSRLAAARKQLAVRLTARGVAPALVPFAVSVPAALAAAATSDVPSATVSKLTEVLMRTSGTAAAAKWLATLAAVTTVVIGLSLGDDPKPAAAKAVEKADPAGGLVLLFHEEAIYLTPAGKEVQRIDYGTAKKADPELFTGTLTIGTNGITLDRFLPVCGRSGPGGVVPLASNGLRLLAPGPAPTVKGVPDTADIEPVVAWAADGKSFVSRAAEVSTVWGVTAYTSFRVTAATGKREPLPLGPEYEVIDASADGKWFLTRRHVPRPLGLPGFSADGTQVSLVTADGNLVYEQPFQNSLTAQVTGHRLAPDGRRSAACGRLRPTEADSWQPSLAVYTYPPAAVTATGVHFQIAKPFDAECMAVAWSPDGKQIVSCWRPISWKGKQPWHVVVCDQDGSNKRTVATFEMKNNEQIRSVDWW